ncbi:MAG: T9SS type A sorting domain-containing protein, partial [Candidatus Lokiarchaeota archaeon]|nr:T9SS type A sorting domain-containing protein [Candidatus Lokiarchaeota archaeon]
MNSGKLISFVFWSLLFSTSYSNLFSQTITVNGKLTDQFNQPVTDAQLKFINETDTNIVYTTTTNSLGEYNITLNIYTDVAGQLKSETNPKDFKLHQNYPNPLNSYTNISFELHKSSHVNLSIYNIIGQRVRTLLDAYHVKGSHEIAWDGLDESGHRLPAAIYICQMTVDHHKQTTKMLLTDGSSTTLAKSRATTNVGHLLNKSVASNYYTVRITGMTIEPFQQKGILIDKNMELNFVVESRNRESVTDIVGPDGGIIEDTNPNSDVYGVRIEIPAGAVASETEITIKRAEDMSQLPTDSQKQIGHTYDFTKSNGNKFNSAIKINIPVTVEDIDTTKCFMAYWDTNKWIRLG